MAVLILNSRFKCECIAGIENGVAGFGDKVRVLCRYIQHLVSIQQRKIIVCFGVLERFKLYTDV